MKKKKEEMLKKTNLQMVTDCNTSWLQLITSKYFIWSDNDSHLKCMTHG